MKNKSLLLVLFLILFTYITHTQPMETSTKQLAFEFMHLQTKLHTRDIISFDRNANILDIKAGRDFTIVKAHANYEAKIIKR